MRERVHTAGETGSKSATSFTTFPTTFVDVSSWNQSSAPSEFEVEVIAFAAEVLVGLAVVGDCLSGRFDYGQLNGGDNITLAATTLVVASASIAHADEEFTSVAHGLLTGQGPIRLTTSNTLPAGTASATDYWIISTGNDTFQLATSKRNAEAGTALAITSDGVGNQTLNIPTRAYRELIGHSSRTKGYGFYCTTHTNSAQVRISVHAVERKLV